MTKAPIEDERVPPSSKGGHLAHYQLLSRLGEGGMGVVYRALDTKLRREVALKVIHPRVAKDAERRRRFLREGRLAAHLTHPCIATVYDVGEVGDRVYIAMELVAGDSLADRMASGRTLHFTESLQIIHEVVRGLQKAHEVGVIHRDLKPDNVIVGDEGIVKILDFGVAKPLDNFEIEFTDIKTQHGSLVGTPAYMSPEQAAGKDVDPRSDIFSVGVLMYELLTGSRPFAGETWQEVIIAINRDDVTPVGERVAGLPAEVDMIVRRCMAKKAEDRYPSCKELLEELSTLVMAGATGTVPPGTMVSGILTTASRAISQDGVRRPPSDSSERASDPSVSLGRTSVSTARLPSRGRTLALVGITAVVTLVVGVAFIGPDVESGTESGAPTASAPLAAPSGSPLPAPSGVLPAETSGEASGERVSGTESDAVPEPRSGEAAAAAPNASRPKEAAALAPLPTVAPRVPAPAPAPTTSPAPKPKPKENPLLGF